MTLLTAGNLGDVLIQATILKSLGISPKKILAPSNYETIVREVYGVDVLTMKTYKTESRLAIFSGCPRDDLYAEIISQVTPQIGGEKIFSLVLTDEEIAKRSKNIYQCYIDIFKNRFENYVEPAKFDQIKLQSLNTLPTAHDGENLSKQILICPVGGLGVKTMPTEIMKEICSFATSNGYTVKIMLTSFDQDPYSAAGLNYDVEKIEVKAGMLKMICELFEKSRLIVSVDTAWYHLANIQGYGAIPIPGPRSVNHFGHPNSPLFKRAYRTTLSCMDCYSGGVCVANHKPACEAKPSPQEVVQVISEHLGLTHIVTDKNRNDQSVKLQSIASNQIRLKLHLKLLAPLIRYSITHPEVSNPARKLFQWLKVIVKLVRRR